MSQSAHMRARARSFGTVAEEYERSRPEYPPDAVDWLVGREPLRVVDVGAGTGKLTRQLVALRHDVTAVEPSEPMLAQLRAAVPGARTIHAGAEEIPLADESADVVVAGQAFHWFDPDRALPEIARVLAPDGRLGLVWNMRDESVPWIARLWDLIGDEPEATGDFDPASAALVQSGPLRSGRDGHVRAGAVRGPGDSWSTSSRPARDRRGPAGRTERAAVLHRVGALYELEAVRRGAHWRCATSPTPTARRCSEPRRPVRPGRAGPRSRAARAPSRPRRGRRPRACPRSSCHRRPCRSGRGPRG